MLSISVTTANMVCLQPISMLKKYIFPIVLIIMDLWTKASIGPVIFNSGAAFSSFSHLNLKPIIFFTCLLLLIYYLKLPNPELWLIFFLAGALGNAYDRLIFDAVRDWIQIPYFPAIFNLADVYFCGAVALYFFQSIKKD